MFMVFKRKHMVITALVLMLGIAGYLNYRYDGQLDGELVASEQSGDIDIDVGETVMVSSEADTVKEEDVFASIRLERDQSRAKLYEELQKTLESEWLSLDLRTQAEDRLSQILDYQEAEATAENLLSAKGFKDTLVYITEESVTVNIKQDDLSRSDTAKIVDVVYELTQNNNIKIVEVK